MRQPRASLFWLTVSLAGSVLVVSAMRVTDVHATPPHTLLVGPFHLPTEQFGPPYTGALRAFREPQDVLPTLEAARRKHVRLIITFGGSRQRFQQEDGAFSLERFSAVLERFRKLDLRPYVQDGTLLCHLLFDEPHDPSNWNGRPVPFADIDAAAAVSQRVFPGVPTGVAGPPSFLARGAPYQHLEFALAQYVSKRGDFDAWVKQELASAARAHLEVVFSLNVLRGNQRAPMTADQLRQYGLSVMREPAAYGLLMWKWDAQYFDAPDIQAALRDITREE